jgi:microcystin-dependent protein
LPISEFETLFNLIGTTYGGDGQSTFALPDLRGRVPIHQGMGPDGTSFSLAQSGGVETVTLTLNQIPVHAHPLVATSSGQQEAPSSSTLPASTVPAIDYVYGPTGTSPTQLAADVIGAVGGSQPHENRQPFLGVNCIISLFGIFPSQT